ncbi:hypothetical protein CYMTET_9547 [Cymbomonas tetramitiformis]|uniref:Uncharacterized protein n=1 Tax=Cymbomonas tetramitiformis TaxID=36881 RepID=A0AAE0GQT3_9CHLO|nr:hypothetical protein CYMTET_9547 [Cymbomonas tetramitiformis]
MPANCNLARRGWGGAQARVGGCAGAVGGCAGAGGRARARARVGVDAQAWVGVVAHTLSAMIVATGSTRFGVDLFETVRPAKMPLLLHLCRELLAEDPDTLVGPRATMELLQARVFLLKKTLTGWQEFVSLVDPAFVTTDFQALGGARTAAPLPERAIPAMGTQMIVPKTPAKAELYRQRESDIEAAVRGDPVSEEAAQFSGEVDIGPMPAPVTASRLWPPLLRKLWQDTTTVSLAAAGTSVTQWQEFISDLRDAGASVPNMTANACRMAAAFKTDPDKVFLVRGAACGVGFPFKSVPEDTFYTVENYVPAEHWEAMNKEIRKERAAGNVVMVKMEWSIQGISAVGVVAKERKGVIKFRPVWDYSRPEDVGVNSRIDLEKEKFSSIKDAYALLRPGLWMAKLDLTAAYRFVPVAAMYWIAHVFEWDEEVVYGLSLYTHYAHALLAQARGRKDDVSVEKAEAWNPRGHLAHGDWASDCYKLYIDLGREQQLLLPSAMAEGAAAATAAHRAGR